VAISVLIDLQSRQPGGFCFPPSRVGLFVIEICKDGVRRLAGGMDGEDPSAVPLYDTRWMLETETHCVAGTASTSLR